VTPLLDSIPPEPKPVAGWPLALALRLDLACPAYLRCLCTGSTLKRQANFIAMTVLEEKGSDHLISCFETGGIAKCHRGSDPLTEIARVLMTARAQAIYEALFGQASSSFVRLTHRIGNGPLSPSAYRKLIDLMYRSEYRHRARLLTQGCPISQVSIECRHLSCGRSLFVGCIRSSRSNRSVLPSI
jgi:hypothetical protein